VRNYKGLMRLKLPVICIIIQAVLTWFPAKVL